MSTEVKFVFFSGLKTDLRSSRSQIFFKIGVLKNFAGFTGKHMCQSLFFNKVAGMRPATLLKKDTLAQLFSVNFVKFLGILFL